jgi:hypothetical protein
VRLVPFSNSRGSRFHADDCKKEEKEADRAQDGREEGRAQNFEEEESFEEKAESETESRLTQANRAAPLSPSDSAASCGVG